MRHLLLAFSLLVAASFFVSADEVIWPPPSAPAGVSQAEFPLPRIDEIDNFRRTIFQARSRPIDLIFDGDSITAGFRWGGGRDLFLKFYGARNAIDFATGGDRTENVLWRLQNHQLDTLKPKLVMLMIGTNNLNESTSQEITAGITKIVEGYRTQCPGIHVLLLGIFPRGHLPTDGIRAKIKEINGIISKLDDGQHVTYLDIGDKFLEPDGTITQDTMFDYLHPTAKGYQIWADAVQPMIDKYCPAASATAATGAPGPKLEEINKTLTPLSWPLHITIPAGAPAALFPTPHASWLDRFTKDQKRLAQGPYDFVMDGDSCIDFWQGAGRGVLAKHFGNIKVLDNGVLGDRVENVLWRVQHGDLDGLDPKLIMLLVGMNNGGQQPKDIAAGIKLVIGEYEKRCPHAHILLLGVFPRDDVAAKPVRQWIKDINAILSTYGSDPKVTYMDIGDKFLTPDGTLTKDIMPDFTNPNEKGYEIWANAIQPVVDKYVTGAAAK